jgi:hypothetical protein
MQTRHVLRGIAFVLFVGPLVVPSAFAQDTDDVVVPLTDASRPVVLSVKLFSGDVIVRGTKRTDVAVRHRQAGRGSSRRNTETPPGMRRLTPTTGLRVEESNNQVNVIVGAAGCGNDATPSRRPLPVLPPQDAQGPLAPPMPSLDDLPCALGSETDLQLEVPLRTSVQISTMNGDIAVHDVDGRMEINSMSGDITLTNVGGSVVANSVAGDVVAVLTRAEAGAPMSFTTLNGKVDVMLPASIKVNLRLRTLSGDMFSDFDIPTVSSRGGRQGDGRFRFEIERAVVSALNGGGADVELRSFTGDIFLRRGK